MKTIKRTKYLEKIKPFFDSNYIKAITGIRRSGKSVLLKQIIEELRKKDIKNILFYDLESEDCEDIKTRKDLENRLHEDIKNKGFYYILIDEVQHIEDFEIALASIRVSYKCSIFVTGSNSKLLLGKLSDRLTGRAKEFVVEPFTYSEVIEYKKINKIKITDDSFYDYLKWGGMPQRFLENNEQGIIRYFESIYNSIIKKDVFDKHKRINKLEFKKVCDYVLQTSGRLFSSTSIAKYLYPKMNNKELSSKIRNVNNYKTYIEECFLVNQCKPYYISGKESMNPSVKIYAIDNGLKNSFSNAINTDDSFGLENIIFRELRYRDYDVRLGSLYNGEIDFVAIKGKKKCFIQVCYSLENQTTIEREYGAFKNIKDASPKFVFSLDKIDTSRNGINHINIIEFLEGKTDIFLT